MVMNVHVGRVIVRLPMVCFVMVQKIVVLLVHLVAIRMDPLQTVVHALVVLVIAIQPVGCFVNRPTTNAASFQSATPLMEQWSIQPIVRVAQVSVIPPQDYFAWHRQIYVRMTFYVHPPMDPL